MQSSLASQIESVFQDVFTEQNQGEDPPELNADSILLETGLDSLGFAVLVVRLEETLGFDPFLLSSESFYPKTFGDLVAFYKAYQLK